MVEQEAKFMSNRFGSWIVWIGEAYEKKIIKPVTESEAKKENLNNRSEWIWFHKGEHKEVFAWLVISMVGLAYLWFEAGNVHDSQAFPDLFKV